MSSKINISLFCLLLFFGLTGFKPPKVASPKNDILYNKYGGDVDKMMTEERRKDSVARPYLYRNIGAPEAITPTSTIDDESVILDKAEIMPQFPDGDAGLKEYIASNTAFIPDTLVGKHATVVMKFYINTLGDAKNPVVVKSDNPAFNLQAIMLVDGMPKWTPGTQNGKEINCYITLPIKY